ncbi:MAG: acyl-CoA dehydrogenase family protein [Terricaulis sp.]
MRAFRETVCAFLDEALTPELRAAGRETTGVYSAPDACRVWHRRLFEQGWIAPAWPKAWGGAGWSAQQRAIFDDECVRRDAPILFAGGIRSIGPLLIEMGTPTQRARYLPAILSGDDLWCQGFSEPGAGSDLAAIAATAESDGAEFVLNGQKIWTTGAHLANRMFALFRSEHGSRGTAGLTFLVLDMATPGVSVRPILDLRGEHEFNEVFFDGARVPAENCVGAVHDGWRAAKRLMALARSNNSPASHVRRILKRVRDTLARDCPPGAMSRLVELEIEAEAFCALEQQHVCGAGGDEAMRASMLKIMGSELKQKACALALDVGASGLPRDATALLERQYLGSRAASIYSGANEIQRNIIARALTH